MTRLTASTLLLLVLGCTMPLLASESPARECAELLDRADALQAEGGRLEAALVVYRAAFERCAGAELPLALDARLAARRGDDVFFYGKDVDAAIELYEAGLEKVTEAGGWTHRGRIELLEGLARALDSEAHSDGAEKAAWLHERAVQLHEEAVQVRREVFGPEAPEVAAGLVKLAAVRVELRPELAERLAREALRISREARGLYDWSVFDALAMLKEALQRQEKTQEAETTQELIDQVLAVIDE